MTRPDEFTKEWFRERLKTMSAETVGKCVKIIYDRQTSDEKATDSTRHHNNRGFNHADAKRGTYYGRWVSMGRTLSEPHLGRARKMLEKYCGQLAEEANAKVKAQLQQARAAA